MDLEPGNAKRKTGPVKSGREIKADDEDTAVKKKTKITETAKSTSSTGDESVQWRKNPMLLDPIMRCIFGFLGLKDVKNFRFVSHDWGFAGKQALTSRALIHFKKDTPDRLPIDFNSCFLDSSARFSCFKISGLFKCPWTIEELSNFFDEHQKGIKELTISHSEFISDKETTQEDFDISPWISKSPMVKNDAKYLTKLSIYDWECAIPLHLLKNIKELSLANCRINLEAGIQMQTVKLFLEGISFYRDDLFVTSIKINDIVNCSSVKKMHLDGYFLENESTSLENDLSGNCYLESLVLRHGVIFANWETSKWNIQHLHLDYMDFSPTQMTVNELYLSPNEFDCGSDFDLFAFPRSIEKLGITDAGCGVYITCSEPTMFENLKYLSFGVNSNPDFSFLAHFMNCPQLTHLKFEEYSPEIKLTLIPRAVKTLTLERCSVDWVFGSFCYANLEKIVFFESEINFERISEAKISVHDIIFICDDDKQKVPKSVDNFFNYQNPWSLCKRFYIEKLKWNEMKLEDSVLNEHVDTKSAFYVFQNGEKERVLDEKSFYLLADIPKHIVKDYQV